MRFAAALLLISLISLPAHAADQWQAREVARLNNCSPKKVEVYQASLGTDGKTVYHVDCNMPKMTDAAAANAPDALLIACDESICQLLRAVAPEKK